MSLSHLVYDIFIRVYAAIIRLGTSFNPKARLWVRGRKNWRQHLEEGLSEKRVDLWMHCASLGEFEQGRPVLEALRKAFPDVVILLSFYSPSGYEIRKHYAVADHVCYLPLDTRKNAQDFIRQVNPKIVIFVKYEFWMHFLTELHQRAIPVLLISALFRPTQFFFSWYGSPFLRLLTYYQQIFLQDDRSRAILLAHGITRVTVAGDTRFDRVCKIAEDARDIEGVDTFLGGTLAVVAGSTWPGDEEAISSCLDIMGKWIIAPHEIGESRLRQLEKRFSPGVVRYSALVKDPQKYGGCRVLLIDNIGMLSALYRYGQIAFIGGGFDHGIHNILEAAVYGVPVLFGPKYHKFKEAEDLLAAGAAFSVETSKALSSILDKLTRGGYAAGSGAIGAQYVKDRSGATGKILAFLQQKRFLINA